MMDRDSTTWYLMNMMCKDFNYLVKEDINDKLSTTHSRDSSWPSDNDSNGGHSGGNLKLDNPNNRFWLDCSDATHDDELHMRSNIADWEFFVKIKCTSHYANNNNIHCGNNRHTQCVGRFWNWCAWRCCESSKLLMIWIKAHLWVKKTNL